MKALKGLLLALLLISAAFCPCARAASLPPEPAVVQVRNDTSASLYLSWTMEPSRGVWYQVYRKETTQGGGAWQRVLAATPDNLYRDRGLSLGSSYDYFVRTFDSDGASADSLPVTAMVRPPEPYAYAVPGDGQAVLFWRIPADVKGDPAFSFVVSRQAPGGGWTALATVPADQGTYRDTGLTPGGRYTYRVQTKQGTGNEAWRYSLYQPVTVTASACADPFDALRAAYPNGAAYNKTAGGAFDPDGFTNMLCTDQAHINGTCPCEYHGVSMCMAFAYRLCERLYGSYPQFNNGLNEGDESPAGWVYLGYENRSCVSRLQPGDYVRCRIDGESNEHSLLVWKVDGDTLFLVESNYDDNCLIRWGRQVTKAQLATSLLYAFHYQPTPSAVRPPVTGDGTPLALLYAMLAVGGLALGSCFRFPARQLLRLPVCAGRCEAGIRGYITKPLIAFFSPPQRAGQASK
ncbi:MAG: hypothetical protein PHI98_05580 [Eubacteriales bacterium]|nr:hypothetical protein [Eubacteriales bacterium]